MNTLVTDKASIGKYGKIGLFADASDYTPPENIVTLLLEFDPEKVSINWLYSAVAKVFGTNHLDWQTSHKAIAKIILSTKLRNSAGFVEGMANRLRSALIRESQEYQEYLEKLSLGVPSERPTEPVEPVFDFEYVDQFFGLPQFEGMVEPKIEEPTVQCWRCQLKITEREFQQKKHQGCSRCGMPWYLSAKKFGVKKLLVTVEMSRIVSATLAMDLLEILGATDIVNDRNLYVVADIPADRVADFCRMGTGMFVAVKFESGKVS